MARRTDVFDLDRMGLRSGEGRRLELHVALAPLAYGGQRYDAGPDPVPAVLDVSRTVSSGWALRLRFEAELSGPCVRCLEPATPRYAVDGREVHQPGGGDELASPYVDADGELDLERWARDALALALPAQITCRPDCLGLCPQCGAELNDDPGHAHEKAPDHRWAKLAELRLDGD